MIKINSFIHRGRLNNIVSRWLTNRLNPEDCGDIKRIINYNALLVKKIIRSLIEEIIREVYDAEPFGITIYSKGELKDFVIENPLETNERIEELIRNYKQYPEDYFRETPIDGRLYYSKTNNGKYFIGAIRMKRYRRIAEKSARRISDYLYGRIVENAKALAERRARLKKVSLDRLISSKEEMMKEFLEAEKKIGNLIKHNREPFKNLDFEINDVGGIKLVGDEKIIEEVIEYIEKAPHLKLVEKEVHSGIYNAINLIVEYKINKEEYLNFYFDEPLRVILGVRGLDTIKLSDDYHAFLLSGEDTIKVEIILSTFPEFIESEIGRCMHEERIIRQRQNAIYKGFLAKNVEYLMTYLFAFAMSPEKIIKEIPIKLWVKYIPDYIDNELRKLFKIYHFTLSF